MSRYCVNIMAQSNGDHEVHNLSVGCCKLPVLSDRRGVGHHANNLGAVLEAKKIYPQSSGCSQCSSLSDNDSIRHARIAGTADVEYG